MAKAKQELAWTEIDPASLPEHVKMAYDAYKVSYRAMKEARVAFEDTLQPGAPVGKRIVCGYNFGKLSVALADAEVAKAKATTGDLAAFLAMAQSSGRRA